MNKKQKAYHDCVQKEIILFVKKGKINNFQKSYTIIRIDAFYSCKENSITKTEKHLIIS